MYRIIRAGLFCLAPETAHFVALWAYKFICRIPGLKALIRWYIGPCENTPKTVFGLEFKNPIGLAAGFDKNGHYIDEMGQLGFGFIEIGSVTALPAHGNPRPRLFRLKQDKAIINRMGLNNHGADALVSRLNGFKSSVPLFINVAKTPASHLEGDLAIKDYCDTIEKIAPLADAIVINISCPNSGDGRTFESPDALVPLLKTARTIVPTGTTPLLIKISPDLDTQALETVVRIAEDFDIDGFTATNTTINRSNLSIGEDAQNAIGAGGLSGAPLHARAVEVVRHVRSLTDRPIIGLGGIRNSTHAQNFINAGADLVQLYTGFVYEGPSIIKRISRNL